MVPTPCCVSAAPLVEIADREADKPAKATASLDMKELFAKEEWYRVRIASRRHRNDENIDRWCKDNSVHDLDLDVMSHGT